MLSRVFRIRRVFGTEDLKEIFADYIAGKISDALVEQSQGEEKI